MPVLSVYIGTSCVNALLYFDEDKYTYLKFPFVYSDALYSNYTTPGEFYKSVFSNFCKQQKVSLANCDILVTSAFPVNLEGAGITTIYPFSEVLHGVQSYFPVVIDSCSIVTPRTILSYVELEAAEESGLRPRGDTEMDYYANLDLYPQVNPTDMATKINIDKGISSKTYANPLQFDPSSAIVFTGSRFCHHYASAGDHEELDYMLMVSMLNNEGIYDIRIDRDVSIVLLSMLKSHLKQDITVPDLVEAVGTVINSNGAADCLLKSDVGTSQLVSLEEDKIFIVPLDKEQQVKILVQNSSFGTVEHMVRGGILGIIFDTRKVKADLESDIKIFDSSMHLFSRALNKI